MTPVQRFSALADAARQCSGHKLSHRVAEAGALLIQTLATGGCVFVCGNGGSMGQAQHFAGELTGRYRLERNPLAAVALGADQVHLTCTANDYGYEHVFARQLEALATGGDVLVCLTTSGSSPNVRRASEAARDMGLPVIAVTGNGGGSNWWRPVAAHIQLPTPDTALVQELTLSVIHSLCERVDAAFAEKGDA